MKEDTLLLLMFVVATGTFAIVIVLSVIARKLGDIVEVLKAIQ